VFFYIFPINNNLIKLRQASKFFSNIFKDNPGSQSTPSNADNMDFLTEFYEGCKGLMQQAAARGGNFEARLDQLYQATKLKFLNKFPGNKKGIQSLAATSIDPEEVDRLFGLTVEQNPGPYWRINPWEIYQVSSHLRKSNIISMVSKTWLTCSETSIERIVRVFGLAKKNEAALRLFIDAVLLDVLNAIKEEAGQHEGIKGKGKRPSTESTLNLKDIYMGVETEISYILPTNQPEGTVIKKVTGRMDYNVWYGQPREAETNLLVVEAKQRSGLLGGRYQAMTYMGKSIGDIRANIVDTYKLLALIQRARFEAGRARIPIYGIATDSELWDFIRMDGQGNVRRSLSGDTLNNILTVLGGCQAVALESNEWIPYHLSTAQDYPCSVRCHPSRHP
jgi:hypothetical protein